MQEILWYTKFVGCDPLNNNWTQNVLFWYYIVTFALLNFLIILDILFSNMDINDLAYGVMYSTAGLQV